MRKAGFSVTPAVSVGDALEKLEINPPDLIISETKFSTDLDGFELRRRLRGTPEWAEIPFIFLTAETAIENKIKGLELGVDDYLTKPIYIKEIVTRINILLQKRQRQFLDLRKDGTRFAGRVSDMPVVDVIQTIEVSRKSGVIQFAGGPNRQAAIYFRDGKVIDAEAGTLQGEDAVYRLLTWNEGEFEVEFRTVRRREVIETTSQGLLMEGMRRLDEWSRLLEQLPPLTHRFEIDAVELSTRLGEVPDDNNRILRLFDGKRTLIEVIDASDFGDLECLQAISRLYFEGLLLDLDPTTRPAREPSRPMPVAHVEDSSPKRAPSGPIDLAGLEARASKGSIDSTAAPTQAAASDSTAPVEAADVIGSEPLVSPGELAADMPRARRDSAQAIDEGDVVEEQDEVRSPLTGGYRQSSLRLIDEAVAAAQLIEPSLFADDELAALGIKRATPAEHAAAAAAGAAAGVPPPTPTPPPTPPSKGVTMGWDAVPDPTETPPPSEEAQAAIARVKLELRTTDPRVENARDIVEKAPEPPSNGANGANGRSTGRSTGNRKTLPPPLPSVRAKEIEEAPLLDSDLLTSGEIKLPSEAELAESNVDTTSGEPPKGVTMGWDAVPDPTETPAPEAKPEDKIEAKTEPEATAASELKTEDAKSLPVADPTATPEAKADVVETKPAVSKESADGVPKAISGEDDGRDLEDEGQTDPSRARRPILVRPDDSQGVKMIGSAGRDRAEASGELRPPSVKTSDSKTQRELVTIMPRRKTGEIAQLKSEDVATLDSKGQAKAKAIVEAVDAKTAAEKAEAEAAKAKDGDKPKGDAKTDGKTDKPTARPALESPPRRAAAGGGVSVPERPGRLAQILMVLAAVIGGAAVYSKCKKSKTAPVVAVPQDASDRIVMSQPDATDVIAFGVDAGVDPIDAGRVAVVRDAAVHPDAATVAMTTPDASVAVPAVADAGIDKGKEAAALAAKGRAALAEGEPQAALDLFDQSLKIKKDKRTFVDRGRALHNLGKTDLAVASIDQAIAMSQGYAPAWEQKGLILWSAQRYGDARPALETYLSLVPDGTKADTIRKMLDEPR